MATNSRWTTCIPQRSMMHLPGTLSRLGGTESVRREPNVATLRPSVLRVKMPTLSGSFSSPTGLLQRRECSLTSRLLCSGQRAGKAHLYVVADRSLCLLASSLYCCGNVGRSIGNCIATDEWGSASAVTVELLHFVLECTSVGSSILTEESALPESQRRRVEASQITRKEKTQKRHQAQRKKASQKLVLGLLYLAVVLSYTLLQ